MAYVQGVTPNEIRRAGIEAFAKALGPVGMARFLQQFDLGTGDYTKQRERWLEDLSMEQVLEELESRRGG